LRLIANDWRRYGTRPVTAFETVEIAAGRDGMVQTDCALVAADAVLAMTGEDIATPFRGKYSSVAEPARALKCSSVADLKATFDTLLPPKPIGYLHIQRQHDQIETLDGRDGDLAVANKDWSTR